MAAQEPVLPVTGVGRGIGAACAGLAGARGFAVGVNYVRDRQAADNVRVNAVAPGLIATEIHRPGRLERMAPGVPRGRAGSAEEVAEAIRFLLSDAASNVTGTVLRVTGGR